MEGEPSIFLISERKALSLTQLKLDYIKKDIYKKKVIKSIKNALFESMDTNPFEDQVLAV